LPLCRPAPLACGNYSGIKLNAIPGIGLKLFGFIAESVFTIRMIPFTSRLTMPFKRLGLKLVKQERHQPMNRVGLSRRERKMLVGLSGAFAKPPTRRIASCRHCLRIGSDIKRISRFRRQAASLLRSTLEIAYEVNAHAISSHESPGGTELLRTLKKRRYPRIIQRRARARP